jgi:hypothetical protein
MKQQIGKDMVIFGSGTLDNINKQFYVYDALYAYCNSKLIKKSLSDRRENH